MTGKKLTQSAPQISIIVISDNTREMTLDCLRSGPAQTTVPYELIVVDNERCCTDRVLADTRAFVHQAGYS